MTRRKVRQVVTLPYNLLLHRDARDALGIDLTNQIIVVDEAHSKHFAKRGYNLPHKYS
jgi:chromosome transmission fidelity protein 1